MQVEKYVGIAYARPKFCRELVRVVLEDHGIKMPLVDSPADAIGWMKVGVPRALDVVVFQTKGIADHVGVCIGRGRFLHVEEGARSRIEFLSSIIWINRIEGFYRYEHCEE